MSSNIIDIAGVGKRYKIGATREPYLTLRDQVGKLFSPAERRKRTAAEEFWALRDVSFSVDRGDTIGIIGRNGAGKSTLLKILSQITPPTEGTIRVGGRIGSLLEVGTGFHPELTGRQNIYLNGSILGMSRKEVARKFDEIVAFAEIGKFLDTPVKRYSSGMYVRLAFAVAAHLEPEIMVIDEVLAVGDAQFQAKCLGKMGEVAEQGRTVLFVSHNMAAVKALCRKGVLLDGGTVTALGDIDACIESYLGSHHSGDTIAAHVESHDPRVDVDAVRINGIETDLVELGPGEDVLEVEIDGVLGEPLVCELEVRFFDSQGVPLALFSPGHEAGLDRPRAAGHFHIQHAISLPRLTKGLYTVNIDLTHPGRAGLVHIPSAAVISAEASATPTGIVFEHKGENGWVWLREHVPMD